MKQYKIISAQTEENLEKLVNQWLTIGEWNLQGGVCVDSENGILYQAIYKHLK